MINYNIIGNRIARIRELLVYLEKIKKVDKTTFIEDMELQLIAERSIQIISQAILDIGNHLIAHFGWGKPETYREVISILAENEIFSKKYLIQLTGLAGLRNILVHDYLSVDPSLLYQDIINGFESIEDFIKQIEKKFHPNIKKEN